MSVPINALVFLGSLLAMELVALLVHRHVMHGWGWAWHASHHGKRTGVFEKNDLYAVFFAGAAIALIYAGSQGYHPLEWIGAGMTAYGLLYFVFHDGLVHKRWPFRHTPRSGYLKRLYQAHRLHHAVEGRHGCVSYGFLWAPSVRQLKAELHRIHGGPIRKPTSAGSGKSPAERALP